MWSGIDGMPSLMSLKWTSDRSLIGSLILMMSIVLGATSAEDVQEDGGMVMRVK